MWCRCKTSGLCFVPPAPDVMARLYAEYLQRGKPYGLSFDNYLRVIGFANVAEVRPGMDDGVQLTGPAVALGAGGPALVQVPARQIRGPLRVKVLLVDFSDKVGTLPAPHYETMLFSKATYPTGSMRDFYSEVSLGKVDVTGSVHGWLRLPQEYSYYANKSSGTGNTYPRNAQGLAEDAVRAALAAGVEFEPELDALGQHAITALFIVHAGVGAETQPDKTTRDNNIWSHKWTLRNSIGVGNNLQAAVYLTVPNDAKVGVCAHELGHLAFQWEDFYDPNYDEDGSEWDGSGRWDLMAGGSWNGGGARPAHPAGLHKLQHGWLEVQEVQSTTDLTLLPYSATAGKVVKVVSPQYRPGQYLLLENRKRTGFDSDLPGEGLLVWRVDESQQMFKPDRPALLLLQADGRHDLERASDWNDGDAGDPFPGSASRSELDDQGELSTTFEGGNGSGVRLRNIVRDLATGQITLAVAFDGEAPTDGTPKIVQRTVSPDLAIPDSAPLGVTSSLELEGPGAARELAVDVQIDHGYASDLRVELIAPSGKVALLHNRAGGNTANVRTVYRSTEVKALQTLVGEPLKGTWRLRVADVAASDVGVLRQWGLAIAVDTEAQNIVVKCTPNLAIPDGQPAGSADTITVARAGTAKAISVQAEITHPDLRELRIELVGPDGQRALLQNAGSGHTENLKKTFTSADTAALAVFIGREVRGAWALRVADLTTNNTGTLTRWELALELSGAAKSVQQESAVKLAIPDNTPAGVASPLAFKTQGTVQALELRAIIEHPYIGDLRVELVAPSGQTAWLHDQVGGRTKDLTLELSSSASSPLHSLVGQPAAGKWLLRVSDLAGGDVGILQFWSLRLTYS
ncbi:MAG: hypothetical protein RL701_1858 [Pseudomonadota bacterium]